MIGVVERAWIAREGEGLVGRATVRFSDRADVEPIWRDVASGIVRNVSVGYAVRSYEITETDGQPPVWRAVDWQPLELSAVPIGADAAAGFRAAGQQATQPTETVIHPCHLLRRTRGAHSRGADDDPRRRDRDHAAGGRRCGRAGGHPARRAGAGPGGPCRGRASADPRRQAGGARGRAGRDPGDQPGGRRRRGRARASRRAASHRHHPRRRAQARRRRIGRRRSRRPRRRRRRRPRGADRCGRRARRPGRDPAARPHRRARRDRDPALRRRGGAAAPLRPRPLRALRARP